MLYVGIDWADDHHDGCFTQFQMAHSMEGFPALHAQTAQHQAHPATVSVVLETTRGL
jgi:hypothetical protein